MRNSAALNGTLAGRLGGYTADAAIISEPPRPPVTRPLSEAAELQHLLRARGGVLNQDKLGVGVVEQLGFFLSKLENFAQQRRQNARVHPLYSHNVDPVLSVTKVITSPWGSTESITVPEQCQIELYRELMPGETQADIEAEFSLGSILLFKTRQSFSKAPRYHFPETLFSGRRF